MRPYLLLVPAAVLLLAACGKEPYEDADLAGALHGVDHVTSSSAGCNDTDFVWKCRPTVELDATAGADDIAAAIRRTAGVLRQGKDSATVRVGGRDVDTDFAGSGAAGATAEFSSRPPDVDALAAGMAMVVASDDLGSATFETRGKDPGVSITLTFAPETPMAAVAARSRSLMEASGGTSVRAVEPRAHLQLAARADAWPDAELAVLEAVRAEHLVVGTIIRKGFLSIVLTPGDDLEGARAIAAAQPGFDTIGTLDVTDDPEADISNAGEGVGGEAAAIADALRQQPGYRSLTLANENLRVDVDSLEQAEAMDAVLEQSFATTYDAISATYIVKGVATVSRPRGGQAWFDTARALADSGLFTSVKVGDRTPRGEAGAVDVVALAGVPPTDAARAVARVWQPDRAVAVKLTWVLDERAFTFFDAGDTITVEPSARVTAKVATAIEKAWAQGRVD